MTRYVRWFAVGGVASALVIWSLALVANGTAADDDKEVKNDVLKLADVEAQKDADAAQKQAKALADKVDEIAPVMDLLKPRGDGGLGVGPTAGKITPDGIEKKLIALDKEKSPMPAPQLTAQSEALARMGEEMAAVADVARFKCPVKKKEGEKDPKDWAKWTDEMHKTALEFADAAKAKDAAKLKTVTRKLNSTCTDCHSVFRD